MERIPTLRIKPNTDVLEKEKNVDEIEEIAELIKKEGIGQVVIHGKDIYRDGKKTGNLSFSPDLDTRMALTLLNEYNNLPADKLYTENAFSSVIPMGSGQKNLDSKNEKGLRIFLDVGGEWIKIESEEGKTKTIYIDHHGEGKREPTSATKMVYEILKKGDLLKDKSDKKLEDFVKFVNDFDNLSYRNKKTEDGSNMLTEKYFKYTWPRTLYALADEIPLDKILDLYKTGKIKNLSEPFTRHEIGENEPGEIGKIVVNKITDKNGKTKEITIKDLCEQKENEARITIKGIKQAKTYADENKLNLNTSSLGKIVFQNFPKVRAKDGKIYTNKILQKTAYLGALSLGYDSVVFWNPKNETGDKRFFINSDSENLSEIGKKIMNIAPGTTDVRGVFIFSPKNAEGVKNITQEQFLNIIDPKILENATVIKGEGFQEKENEYVVEEAADKNEGETKEELETKIGKPVNTKEMAEEAQRKLVQQEKIDKKTNGKEERKDDREERIKLEIELQTNLNDARAKYAEEYKKFMHERKQNTGFFTRVKRKFLGETVRDEEVPENLKNLEKEYNNAAVLYGQNMHKNKYDLLLESEKSDAIIIQELDHYKQNEIFNKVIIEEEEKLTALKAENLPPKEKALWKKGVDWYLKQNRWTKVAISTAVSTAVIATFLPSMMAAGGVTAGFLATKYARGIIGGVVGQIAAKGYDSLVKEHYTDRKKESLEELAKKFGDKMSDKNLLEYKKEYAKILEKERISKRNRLFHKAGIAMAAGGFAAYEVGNLVHQLPTVHGLGTGENNTNIPGAGKSIEPEHIFKTEQVQFSSRGAIQTIENLKIKIHADYPDLSKAPHSIQEFMKTNSTQEAIRLGFYNPNSDAESAMVIKGSTLEFDQRGNLIYHDVRTGEAHNLISERGSIETTEKYGGKMFDSDKSGQQFQHESKIISEPLEGKGVTEIGGSAKELLEKDLNDVSGSADNLLGIKAEPIDSSADYLLRTKGMSSMDGHENDNIPTERIISTHKGSIQDHLEKPHTNPPEKMTRHEMRELKRAQARIGTSEVKHVKVGHINEQVNTPAEDGQMELQEEFNKFGLSHLELEQVKYVYDSNINHLFPKKESLEIWDTVKNSSKQYPAEQFVFNGPPVDPAFESTLKPLGLYMQKLYEVTGIIPREGTLLVSAETTEEYIKHCLEFAKTQGDDMLDELKTYSE